MMSLDIVLNHEFIYIPSSVGKKKEYKKLQDSKFPQHMRVNLPPRVSLNWLFYTSVMESTTIAPFFQMP